MSMVTLTLEREVVERLVNIIANAPVPWVVSNPLLTLIGQQMREEREPPPPGHVTSLRGLADGEDRDERPH